MNKLKWTPWFLAIALVSTAGCMAHTQSSAALNSTTIASQRVIAQNQTPEQRNDRQQVVAHQRQAVDTSIAAASLPKGDSVHANYDGSNAYRHAGKAGTVKLSNSALPKGDSVRYNYDGSNGYRDAVNSGRVDLSNPSGMAKGDSVHYNYDGSNEYRAAAKSGKVNLSNSSAMTKGDSVHYNYDGSNEYRAAAKSGKVNLSNSSAMSKGDSVRYNYDGSNEYRDAKSSSNAPTGRMSLPAGNTIHFYNDGRDQDGNFGSDTGSLANSLHPNNTIRPYSWGHSQTSSQTSTSSHHSRLPQSVHYQDAQ